MGFTIRPSPPIHIPSDMKISFFLLSLLWGSVSWQGSKRLPDTDQNPEAFRLAQRSPDFWLLNG